MAQRGWLIDLGRCIGCHSCTVACKSEQNTAPLNSPLLFANGNPQRPLHLSYRWVVVREGGTYPNVWRTFVTSACNHCQTPACMNACPVDAISKRASDGIVLIDQDKCIGCKYCVWACPYGAPQWNAETQKVEKCTMCVHRTDKGLEPACATTCIGKALTFVADFDPARSGENAPDGFASPGLTRPSVRFVKKMIAPSEWASARGQLYRWLAAAFLRPPGEVFVAPFLDGETLAALGERCGGVAVAELDRFRQDFDGDYEALDQEYQSLFVVPTGRYVTPYEAVYRDERVVEDEVVSGLLMGPSTMAVTALYREAGAEVAPDLLELPDHVGLELGCMRFLCEAEARAWERGDLHAAKRAQQLQWRLLTEHLLEWIPALCRRIRANASGPLYRGIADLTEALVRQDAEAPAGSAAPEEVSQCE